ATGGAIAAEAATPFGATGAIFPLRLLGVLRGAEVTSRTIVEHRPPVLTEISPAAAVGLVGLLALAAVAAVLSWRRLRLSHLLVASAFVWLALLARRNLALVGPGVIPFVAAGLAPALAAVEARPRLATMCGVVVAIGLAVETARVATGAYYDTARVTRVFGI